MILSFSTDFLICHRGVMLTASQNLTQKPKEWTTSAEQLCDLGEVCQETLLLIHAGGWAAQEGKSPTGSWVSLPWIPSPELPAWFPSCLQF